MRILLEAEDPALRGEAALALAAAGGPEDVDAIARVAMANEPSASVPATIGLGVLGVDGVEYALGKVLSARGRDRDIRRTAAAFGFGLLPAEHPAPVFERFLRDVEGGSYARNHDALVAWLAALSIAERPGRLPVVEFLIADEANHDDVLRAAALRALTRFRTDEPVEIAKRWLDADHSALRRAALDVLTPTSLRDQATRVAVTRVVQRDDDTAARARALDLLTNARVFAALEFSESALESDDPQVVAAGVRAILATGGHVLRDALGRAVLDEPNAERRIAMLDAWHGRVPIVLVDGLLRELGASAQEASRRAAVRALANSRDPRVADALRFALARSLDRSTSRTLIDALQTTTRGDRRSLLAELEEDGLIDPATRIELLASTDPRRASAELAAAVDDGRLTTAERTRCVRAWRCSVLPGLPREVRATLPRAVAAYLVDD